MSKDPKKTDQATGQVVYCGPTIPGKAVQFTTYTHGLSSPLLEAVQASPVLKALVVPLDQLPDVQDGSVEQKDHRAFGGQRPLQSLVVLDGGDDRSILDRLHKQL